jgi:hypothetical protein
MNNATDKRISKAERTLGLVRAPGANTEAAGECRLVFGVRSLALATARAKRLKASYVFWTPCAGPPQGDRVARPRRAVLVVWAFEARSEEEVTSEQLARPWPWDEKQNQHYEQPQN